MIVSKRGKCEIRIDAETLMEMIEQSINKSSFNERDDIAVKNILVEKNSSYPVIVEITRKLPENKMQE